MPDMLKKAEDSLLLPCQQDETLVNLFADILLQRNAYDKISAFVIQYQQKDLPYFVVKYDKNIMNLLVQDILKENIV